MTKAKSIQISDSKYAILWYQPNSSEHKWYLEDYPSPYPDSGWGEIFKKSIGRIRIVFSTDFGLKVWELKNFYGAN